MDAEYDFVHWNNYYRASKKLTEHKKDRTNAAKATEEKLVLDKADTLRNVTESNFQDEESFRISLNMVIASKEMKLWIFTIKVTGIHKPAYFGAWLRARMEYYVLQNKSWVFNNVSKIEGTTDYGYEIGYFAQEQPLNVIDPIYIKGVFNDAFMKVKSEMEATADADSMAREIEFTKHLTGKENLKFLGDYIFSVVDTTMGHSRFVTYTKQANSTEIQKRLKDGVGRREGKEKRGHEPSDGVPMARRVTTRAGEMWNEKDESGKESYKTLARADKERYDREMAVYNGIPESDKPKGKLNAYMHFFLEEREEIQKILEQEDAAAAVENARRAFADPSEKKPSDGVPMARRVTTRAGAMWKEKDESGKELFKTLARADKERYDREMAVYNGIPESMRSEEGKPKGNMNAYMHFFLKEREEIQKILEQEDAAAAVARQGFAGRVATEQPGIALFEDDHVA
mgnify:CR=1 FL=1